MNTIAEKGILYIATGKKYIDEVILAAASCKKHNNYPIALITDTAAHELPVGLFDTVLIKKAAYNYRDKLLIKYSPFEQTIFLDTDTFVAGPLDGLFTILTYREFAIHQADEGYEYSMPELSSAMPEFNTGVIAFRLTGNVCQLIDQWEQSFHDNPSVVTDQYHLRKTLYASAVNYAIFSSAYNFIIYHTNLVMQQVYILHGRPMSVLPGVAADVNQIRNDYGWRRAYHPAYHKFFMIHKNMDNSDIYKLLLLNLRALAGNYLRKIGLKNKKRL